MTKFNEGDKVLYKGKEVTVEVTTKNFSTNAISYVLSTGEKVSENELIPVGLKATKPAENTPLLEVYKAIFGKAVPANKKNDLFWIQSKIDEKHKEEDSEVDFEDLSDVEKQKYLSTLSFEDLTAFVEAEDLTNVDVEDYITTEELVVAICQELGID